MTETQAGVIFVELATLNELTAAMLVANSALAPTALGAVVAWALFTPDDGEIDKAIQGWDAIGTKMDGLSGDSDGLKAALKPLDDAWVSDDMTSVRGQFDSFIANYLQEIKQTKDAADMNAAALRHIKQDLDRLQTVAFFTAAGSLAVLIALTAAELFPPDAAWAEPLKQLEGLFVSGTTVGIVAAVAAVAGAPWQSVLGYISQGGDLFAKKKDNLHGPGTDFKDIQIRWDPAGTAYPPRQ